MLGRLQVLFLCLIITISLQTVAVVPSITLCFFNVKLQIIKGGPHIQDWKCWGIYQNKLTFIFFGWGCVLMKLNTSSISESWNFSVLSHFLRLTWVFFNSSSIPFCHNKGNGFVCHGCQFIGTQCCQASTAKLLMLYQVWRTLLLSLDVVFCSHLLPLLVTAIAVRSVSNIICIKPGHFIVRWG
jgi:hypothetical protein